MKTSNEKMTLFFTTSVQNRRGSSLHFSLHLQGSDLQRLHGYWRWWSLVLHRKLRQWDKHRGILGLLWRRLFISILTFFNLKTLKFALSFHLDQRFLTEITLWPVYLAFSFLIYKVIFLNVTHESSNISRTSEPNCLKF